MDDRKQELDRSLDLEGSRILLVEDEFYIADDVRRILLSAGAEVIGPVSTVGAAEEAVERGDFDCAVIDLNLHGESALPIADQLVAGGEVVCDRHRLRQRVGARTAERYPQDREAVRTRSAAARPLATRLRQSRTGALNHAQQPENQDQDQDSAETDIHDTLLCLVLLLKRRLARLRSSRYGYDRSLSGYDFTRAQTAGFA